MADELPRGLYELPVTRELADRLADVPDALRELVALDPDRAPQLLTQWLQPRLREAFKSMRGKSDAARATAQLELANAVLQMLERKAADSGAESSQHLVPPAQLLRALLDPADGLGEPRQPARPGIPLSSSDLLVNARHDLRIGAELKKELQSADRVDLLLSFLKWSGFRILRDELRAFLDRRPAGLRVLTTAYMRATERRAVEALIDLGADVRVSYDTDRTRLHAKAWLFHRESGFSTAFIGSSNLSAAAMLDGTEWNVRLSQRDNGPILDRFRTTFDQYWSDTAFEPYDADAFERAIRRQTDRATQYIFRFDVEPRPHQQEMLEELAAERARGHHRNLVVAATGTGKTVVAALDYKRLRAELPSARLLFVAHRREILRQSLTTFQVVLKDGAFGELHVGDDRAIRGTHVFASIQSLNAQGIDALAPDAFDVVIVDEFHHAAAPSYARLLEHLETRVLLGLTATPERTDGQSVLGWFDGRIASELRLWKALDQELLSPFQYFGIGGAPDVSGVTWSRGRYDVRELSNVYTADHWFAKRVLQEVDAKVLDIGAMRALGFCVDVAHAQFMAARFAESGVRAVAVHGKTPKRERRNALSALAAGELQVVFCVDLFNEGVDVPDVDTVIFLRPTESATIFLQQLGRGLRRAEGKACLTVLDFIGDANRRFRFDRRYRAIVGGTRRGIRKQIEEGFPHLPAGCAIELDRQAQASVLANVQHALQLGIRGLEEDLKQLIAERGANVDMTTFIEASGVDLEELYANAGRCWTDLRRRVGLVSEPEDPAVERALSRLLHIDDSTRLDGFRAFITQPTAPVANADSALQRLFFVLLGNMREPLSRMQDRWDALWARPALREELSELLDLLEDRARAMTHPLTEIPLRVHATYALDEVMAAVDERNAKGGVKRIQTGVYHAKARRTDLLFVTLEKSEHEYTPTTLYEDYPISPSRFHWQTQSNCHAGTPTGRRYLGIAPGSPDQALLFVRQRKRDDRGLTMPYLNLGRVLCERWEGDRPMSILWRLERTMPAWFWQETKRAAG